MSKYLDSNGLLYLWGKIKAALGEKVDKLDGYGLSQENFTTAEKIKLAGVNQVVIDDVLSSFSTNPVQNKILKAEFDKYALKTDVTGLYNYKGSVDTTDALPTNANAGDVYDVRATGMNYAWTGTAWDALGSMVAVESIENSTIDSIVNNS